MDFNFKVAFYVVTSVIWVMGSFAFKNKTRYFLTLLAVFFPFEIGLIFYRFHGLMLTDLPIIILLLIGIFTQKGFKLYIPKISLPVLLFFIWAFLGVFHGWPQGYVISDSMRILRGYLIVICMVNFIKTPKDLRAVMFGLFAVLAFQSVLGIYQWRFGALGLRILGETAWISWRSRGTFQHESYFGNYLAFMIPIAYRLFVFHKSRIKREFLQYGFITGAASLALFTAYTRGPWIAFAGATIAMTLWSLHKKKLRPKVMAPIFIIGIFSAIFMVRYIPSIMAQFDSEGGRQHAAKIRMPLNIIALRVIKANPVVGVGMGTYLENSRDFVRDDETMVEEWEIAQLKTDMVHNSYLLITAETGIPGLAFFLWYIVVVVTTGYRCIKSIDPYLSNLSIGILTGYVALMISFLASPDFRIHQINVMIWMMGGIIFGIQNLDEKYRKYVIVQRRRLLEKENIPTS